MNRKPSCRMSNTEYDKQIALVLQGGGALGSYQAGVYEAMAEHGYQPDWVAGTSIGAINSAIIAGNAPHDRVARLRAFWEQVSSPSASWLDSPLAGHDAAAQRDVRTAVRPAGFFSAQPPALLDHRHITDQLLRYVRSEGNVGTAGRFRPHQRAEDPVQRLP